MPPYVLEPDISGDYEIHEYAWHESEFEFVLSRLNSGQFIDFLMEMVDQSWIGLESANEMLKRAGISINFFRDSNKKISALVTPATDLAVDLDSSHVNIRALIQRLDRSLEARDFPAVIHAAASIFEVLSKEVINDAAFEDKTLKSYFDRYRKDSPLPDPLLDYILEIYERRNKEPLAGHGQRKDSELTFSEAVVVTELTKAIVRSEYALFSSGA